MVRVAVAAESHPGHWVVRVQDGDALVVALTYEWLERTSPVSPGLGLVGVCIEWATPAERDGMPVGRVLTPSALRDLPWSRWEHGARTCLHRHLDESEQGHQGTPLFRVLVAHPELGEASKQAERRRKAHMRLVMVADQYHRNVERGLPNPVKAIAAEWEVAPATARSWVYRARREGYLEEANR